MPQTEEERQKLEAERRKNDPYYTPQQQTFEVVCLKKDVSDGAALPEDFKRVTIKATSPYGAMNTPEVGEVEKTGYRALFAANPGMLTDPEILAQQRAISKRNQPKSTDGEPPAR